MPAPPMPMKCQRSEMFMSFEFWISSSLESMVEVTARFKFRTQNYENSRLYGRPPDSVHDND